MGWLRRILSRRSCRPGRRQLILVVPWAMKPELVREIRDVVEQWLRGESLALIIPDDVKYEWR